MFEKFSKKVRNGFKNVNKHSQAVDSERVFYRIPRNHVDLRAYFAFDQQKGFTETKESNGFFSEFIACGQNVEPFLLHVDLF